MYYYLIIRNPKHWAKFLYSLLVFFSLFSLSMIQSRASFVAAALIAILLILWTIIDYLKSRSLKVLPNLFYIIPMILALGLNQILTSDKGADTVSRAATISISQADGSIGRFDIIKDVVTHFSSNPIFGVGMNNWKLSSIHYDREDIDGYIVPYPLHSDFIQLGAELGIIGFMLYLGVFLIGAYFAFILLFKSGLKSEDKWFIFLLISALEVYFIDANLNFPIARPQVLAPWALTMALLSYYYNREKNRMQVN